MIGDTKLPVRDLLENLLKENMNPNVRAGGKRDLLVAIFCLMGQY